MANYLIGDLQGCDGALGRLLAKVDFSPSRDTLFFLGDLVNRGPESLAVLRRLTALGDSAKCLLGNHDLSLLAISQGVRAPHRNDTIAGILAAPDREALLHWLRHRAMAMQAHGILMVHAGLPPQWDAKQAMALAGEVEAMLRGPDFADFFAHMYGNEPDHWSDALEGIPRLRVIVNALTRLRFCTPAGVMHLKATGRPDEAPVGTLPWFDVPGRRSAGSVVAFGHWSQLGLLLRDDVIALDTGCVWGGCLTALRLSADGGREAIQVRCEQAQAPGE